MRAGARRILASQAAARPRTTNLRLWETIVGSPCLFPACYLQGTPQLQRVASNRAVEPQITSSVLSSVSP
jgi:hypothetical protein